MSNSFRVTSERLTTKQVIIPWTYFKFSCWNFYQLINFLSPLFLIPFWWYKYVGIFTGQQRQNKGIVNYFLWFLFSFIKYKYLFYNSLCLFILLRMWKNNSFFTLFLVKKKLKKNKKRGCIFKIGKFMWNKRR